MDAIVPISVYRQDTPPSTTSGNRSSISYFTNLIGTLYQEALPDAYVCRFCGASIPQTAATGITQRLAPDELLLCPTCQLPMAEGFLQNPLHSADLWWVAGLAEPDSWNGTLYGEQRVVFPITLYRCSRCGYLAAYARERRESRP